MDLYRPKNKGSTADTALKRPERPWTAARTMEVLRRCPLAIAQRLVHCATAVSTAVLGQSHKDNVRCTAVEEQPEAKEVQLSQPSSTSLLMISPGTLRSECVQKYASRVVSKRCFGRRPPFYPRRVWTSELKFLAHSSGPKSMQ